LQAFLPDLQQVNALFSSSRSTQARLQGVGTVSTQTAQDLGLCGVVARASGVATDVRQTLPVITQSTGDCWARARQRMAEMEASTQWLIDQLTDSDLNLTDTPDPYAAVTARGEWLLAPNAMVVSLIEGVRGPVMVALETDAQGQLLHAKVQDPSLANWFGLAFALRKQQISDFPICNKSFDLSYCGNDL
jgi:Ni,Fe-hydrogenase III large subunit